MVQICAVVPMSRGRTKKTTHSNCRPCSAFFSHRTRERILNQCPILPCAREAFSQFCKLMLCGTLHLVRTSVRKL